MHVHLCNLEFVCGAATKLDAVGRQRWHMIIQYPSISTRVELSSEKNKRSISLACAIHEKDTCWLPSVRRVSKTGSNTPNAIAPPRNRPLRVLVASCLH